MSDRPSWIQVGVPVAYYPHDFPPEVAGKFYVGIVDSPPRLCGETLVVTLRDMDPRYRDGQRRDVPAAACRSLKPFDLIAAYARLRDALEEIGAEQDGAGPRARRTLETLKPNDK